MPGRVVVAGTAGGVGTTTVTALLAAVLGGVRLLDHTAGTLGDRVGQDTSEPAGPATVLHDLGPYALTAGISTLEDPGTVLVVTAAATPVGWELMLSAAEAVGQQSGPDGLARTVGVLSAVFGRARLPRGVPADVGQGRCSVVVVPADPELAAGGPVEVAALGRGARRSVEQLRAAVVGPARVSSDSVARRSA